MHKKVKPVAVVILNWNGKDLLAEFLPIVVKNTSEHLAQIYVADNGSSDGSVEFVRLNFPTVQLIELDNNYGFSGGYNRAIEQIQEPYTVLLNSDVAVAENWLQPMYDYMQQHNDVGACQPKIRSYRNQDYFEYAGAAGGFIDKYGYPFCRGRIMNVVEKDTGQYDQTTPIFWASGACLMIRTELYKSLGGLDELFFAHMEEIDLCWRLWARGYKILYVPQSLVYHLGGATLNKTNPFKTYLNFRNNWYMIYKNSKNFKRLLFIRFVLDILAFVKFLLGLEFKNAMAVVKAHWAFLFTLGKLHLIRRQNIEKTVCSEIPVIYPKSIVYQFFVKRKKYYHELHHI